MIASSEVSPSKPIGYEYSFRPIVALIEIAARPINQRDRLLYFASASILEMLAHHFFRTPSYQAFGVAGGLDRERSAIARSLPTAAPPSTDHIKQPSLEMEKGVRDGEKGVRA